MRNLILALFLWGMALPAKAEFTIDWHSMDGGGGSSTGGVFSISGTVGQSDAGEMSGGSYVLQGGFWAVLAAVQQPGLPRLEISGTNGIVTLSWPASAAAYGLEQTTDLVAIPGGWTSVPDSLYRTNSLGYTASLPLASGKAYFRLKRR